ncbi:MAG: KH domain-containing protein [Victivallales bacterium]|nr:KH domain-containing protein [Victivallales bacterium]MCF7889545.1 KH domain-containing protein [Victivallales bacterium]
MLKKIIDIFKKEDSSNNVDSSISSENKELKDIVSFVDYVARALVDQPGSVKIYLSDNDKGKVINIDCDKADIGKIIGKNGKTIMSIRQLVAGAATRLSQHISVEVVDKIAD